MAAIFLRPTYGNDANSGLTYALAKKTIQGVGDIAAAGDEMCIVGGEGDITLTANYTLPNISAIYGHPDYTIPNLVGNYTLTSACFNFRYLRINLKAGTNSVGIYNSTYAQQMTFDRTEITAPVYVPNRASTGLRFYNSKIVMGAGNYGICSGLTSNPVEFVNCVVRGQITASVCTGSIYLLGNEWYNTNYLFQSNVDGITLYANFNTFDNLGSIIQFSNASNVQTNGFSFHRNYFNTTGNFFNNVLTGVINMNTNGTSSNNMFHTSSGSQSGYSSFDDSSTSDPKFYTDATSNYRIEYDSPLANYLGDTVGAKVPDWASFFSSLPVAKVQSGYAYRDGSRTNNKVGTLSATGEDDGTKVLTTSSKITGLIPLSDVLPASGGTADVDTLANLPAQNKVLTGSPNYGKTLSKTPSFSPDYADAANVLPNDTTNGVTGTANVDTLANLPLPNVVKTGSPNFGKNSDKVPSFSPDYADASNVLPSDTTNGITGTADVDALANLPAQNKVLTGSPNYGKNSDKTPSYSPDFPARVNVAPDATVNNQTGQMDLPSLNHVSPNDTLRGQVGTQDLPDLANIYNDTLEGQSGTYLPDFPEKENVTSDDTVNGVAGTLDLPALNKVAPTDTLRGVNGTMDLPDLSNLDPVDTLEGVNGTMDLPSLDHVSPSDTLKGAQGTQDLPLLANIYDDTLEGAAGTFNPDYADPENVLDIDTTNSQAGLISKNNLLESAGGLYIPANPDNVLTTDTNQPGNYTEAPEDKVELNFDYGPSNSKTGTLIGGDGPDSSPASEVAQKMVKGFSATIDGILVEGIYDVGNAADPENTVTRETILKKIEDCLYSVDSETNAKYRNKIERVSTDEGNIEGLSDDDYPYILLSDEGTTPNFTYLNSSIPVFTMRVKLIVKTPPSWNLKERDSLYDDIRQCLLYGNRSLNGMVHIIKEEGGRTLPSPNKEDQIKSQEMMFSVRFVQQILET